MRKFIAISVIVIVLMPAIILPALERSLHVARMMLPY